MRVDWNEWERERVRGLRLNGLPAADARFLAAFERRQRQEAAAIVGDLAAVNGDIELIPQPEGGARVQVHAWADEMPADRRAAVTAFCAPGPPAGAAN